MNDLPMPSRVFFVRLLAEDVLNNPTKYGFRPVNGVLRLDWFGRRPRIYRCLLCDAWLVGCVTGPMHLHSNGVEGIMQEAGAFTLDETDLPALGSGWFVEDDRFCYTLPSE